MGERGDGGFEVAPTRIGGSGGPGRSGRGRRRAPLILVIVLAVAIPTVAWAGPRIEWRPEVDLSFLRPTPTPVPSPTPRPTREPTPAPPTPLPAITIGVGPHPTEPFPVDVGGLRLADPATGELGPLLGLRGDTDAIFTSEEGDGWWCVCFARVSGADRETATVEIRRVDPSGGVTFRRVIGNYLSTAKPPAQDFYNRFDLEVSSDQRTAYLSSATRTDDQWAMAVEAIDLATGTIVGRTELGNVTMPPIPGPTPPPDQGTYENYFAGPFMRLSPDGRRMLVWAWVEAYSSTGEQQTTIPLGWLIDVDSASADGAVGRPAPVSEAFAGRLRGCYWITWTTDDELAAICWPTDQSGSTVGLVVLDPNGTERGHVDLPSAMNSWLTDPALDRANRLVYLWMPNAHTLQRVDLDTRRIDELKVDPKATVNGPSGSAPGGSGSGVRPEWGTFTSDLRLYYGPQLLPEPGGSRLFALGILPEEGNARRNPVSSGIWVFDATGFSLSDRWGAVAAYGTIGLSRDGRWLLAAGAPGTDEQGNQADWQASITVHDVSDGRPALQLGRLGTDGQVFQVPP